MTIWEVVLFGLLLGVRHAFDPDHLVAVTTIVSEYKNPLRAVWIGVSWGLGHTTTLLLAGGTLLLLGVRIPENYARFFEFLVGVMLIVLGAQTFWSFRRNKVHLHPHRHEAEGEHKHFHFHQETADHSSHPHPRWKTWGRLILDGIKPDEHGLGNARRDLRPFFRLKSYAVGTVHGLAGSAALMLLVLAGIRSPWSGIGYMALFGLGTVLSMGVISIAISLPFTISGKIPRANRIVQAVAGAASIAFGVGLIYSIGVGQQLLNVR
ncbi:MAG: sulfite exporter TauE/SafE family protein [Chloroflexi bacterium]|nr:sulfite exporter TauE/SafE family protein [Chloroflexota bacterium]